MSCSLDRSRSCLNLRLCCVFPVLSILRDSPVSTRPLLNLKGFSLGSVNVSSSTSCFGFIDSYDKATCPALTELIGITGRDWLSCHFRPGKCDASGGLSNIHLSTSLTIGYLLFIRSRSRTIQPHYLTYHALCPYLNTNITD